MKRLCHHILIATLALLGAVACNPTPNTPSEEEYISVSETSLQLDAAKGSFVLQVESNTAWSVTTAADWISPSTKSYSGSASALFSYTANPDSKSRSALLTFAPTNESNAASHQVVISQSGTTNNGDGNTGGNGDGDGNGDGNGDGDGDGDGNGNGNTGGNGTEGKAKYAGWAELPAEEGNPDYYYAYHLIPDIGNGKVRNFAVCYSAELGCPVWVASPMHSYYTAKNTSRSDAYAPDPDIPTSIQVHKRNGYTRGHMLGSSDRLVSRGANEQAFYYSNIGPQLQSGFNTGGGVWNNLEEYCDGLLCADTLYMINGCYWENRNTSSSGTVIPTHYYKVLLRTKSGNTSKWVVNCSASELKCVAFLVEHNSEQFKVEPHKGMLMSVSDLEALTGHTFFPNVPNAPKDTFNASDWGL